MPDVGWKREKPDFADAVRKVERARVHIESFDAEASKHFLRQPFQVSLAPFKRRGHFVFGVGERIGFPDRMFSVIIGDVVHNLRTALDYLIAACACARGEPIHQTEFPIRTRKEDVKGLIKRRVGPAGALAERLVLRSRPYRRGNRYLHALHEFDRRDKHRLVVPVACVTKVRVSSGGWNDLPMIARETIVAGRRGRLIPVPSGYEQAIMTEANFEAEIVFARDTPTGSEPCVEALEKMYSAVVDVIAMFEDAHGTLRLSAGLRAKASPAVQAAGR